MKTLFTYELKQAARGVIAILGGRRDAAQFFDLSLHGLVGSIVVFIIAATFNAFLPGFVVDSANVASDAVPASTPTMALILVALVFIFQTGFSAIALRQFGRLDGLVPYLVVSNWATFFFTGLVAILRFLNPSELVFLIVMATVLIISEVNTLRLILGLKFAQIALFLIAQFVGALGGLMLFWVLNPGQV